MSITISLIAILGLLLFFAIKLRSATTGAVIIAVLFGFYLSRTDAAPSVDDTVTSITDALTDIGN
ncbi:hypothetical protein [Streptomyces sp. RTd22]|uniref:hypothetical protein n=1 Tax=Streptomyces sp. RTd22 TaxID=1841249 RepID=UPI0007C54D3F|nr:hypothetical protein [Streptomyces sp. RTd22]